MEEGAVELQAGGGRSGAALLHGWVVLPGGIRAVDHAPTVLGGGEGHRGPSGYVVPLEAECLIADRSMFPVPMPANIEAHVRGNRPRASPANCVEEVVVVLEANIVCVEASPSGCSVEADRRRRDRNCPEQPRASDPGLEVVPLMGRIADGARVE